MKRIFLLLIPLVVSSCVVAETAQPTPVSTLTARPTEFPTPTTDWFPATATPTSLPTVTVTPRKEKGEKVGDILYEDPFESGQNWFVPATSRGEVHIGDGELNLIIKEPESFLYSVLEGINYSDFYAEITASPSLCTGKDEYGMMIRASGAQRYYRFSLSCDGEIRFRKYGQTIISLQPWVRSASVPNAAPSEVRLGVSAVGEEFRLFVDGVHQFTIRDEEIKRGSVGVFARAAGDTAVTVSFSDLVVREIVP